jgi:hypothetical protein
MDDEPPPARLGWQKDKLEGRLLQNHLGPSGPGESVLYEWVEGLD